LLAKKLNILPCEVPTSCNLSEKALLPLISLRTYTGRSKTAPSSLQEKVISILLPKLKAKTVTANDIKATVRAIAPARKKYKSKKKEIRREEINKQECLNDVFMMLNLANKHVNLTGKIREWFKEIIKLLNNILVELEKYE